MGEEFPATREAASETIERLRDRERAPGTRARRHAAPAAAREEATTRNAQPDIGLSTDRTTLRKRVRSGARRPASDALRGPSYNGLPVPSEFVHLHVHSEYSILDGACRIPALAARAAELEMPAVGLTDHGSLAGAVELYRETAKHGVKPLIGCEVYVCDDRRAQTKGYAHLTLLAESNEGYGNLIKLASAGYLEGYYYKPRVDWELLETHAKGLVALSGLPLRPRLQGARGEPDRRTRRPTSTGSRRSSAATPSTSRCRTPGSPSRRGSTRSSPSSRASRSCRSSPPATSTTSCTRTRAHTRRCSASSPATRSRTRTAGSSTPTSSTSRRRPRWPPTSPTTRTRSRARSRSPSACNVEIELGVLRLPKFPTPDGRDAFDYLVELCEKGLEKRYGKVTPELAERLQFELKTIREMGFADYFLIVWDFIAFAKRNGISVGPGRGSAAGSLAAYCLEITDVDPIHYGLLFERFLNPGRKSMPDMDIDFAVAGRDRVINYVAEKYGRDRVAQIITFSTMMARAAVRDAGRVLEIPYGTVDKVAKLIPEGPKVYLDDCLKPSGELRKAYDADPLVKEIVDLAKPLEGLVRADSIHAAAVVIGDRPLTEYVPLQQKGADQEVVTQFPMGDVEALGLLKMDFLGLRNLDVIDKAVALVDGLDIEQVPLDDTQHLRDARARRVGRRLPVRVLGHARGAPPGAGRPSSRT